MMLPHPDEIIHRPERKRKAKSFMLMAGVVALVLAVIVAAVVISSNNKHSANSAASQADAAVGNLSPSQTKNLIVSHLEKLKIDTAPLDTDGSYQAKALEWISKVDELLPKSSEQVVLQRFALACFYFSTNKVVTKKTPTPKKWITSEGWLTSTNECGGWMGVQCRNEGGDRVTGIHIPSNELTGSIPEELALIADSLQTLDLGRNKIYMDKFDAFKALTNLHELHLTDNHIKADDGIPSELAELTKLERLRLTGNDILGRIKGRVVQNWKNLQQLELEDCLLTGSLPTQLGSLKKLQRVYLRDNDINTNLDFIKKGKLQSLSSLWLSGNIVTGGIPTQIGLLASLQELKLANCGITGTIPSEFSKLSALSEVTLQDNALTSIIPKELHKASSLKQLDLRGNGLDGTVSTKICDTFDGYDESEDVSFMVDCDKVSCKCCDNCPAGGGGTGDGTA